MINGENCDYYNNINQYNQNFKHNDMNIINNMINMYPENNINQHQKNLNKNIPPKCDFNGNNSKNKNNKKPYINNFKDPNYDYHINYIFNGDKNNIIHNININNNNSGNFKKNKSQPDINTYKNNENFKNSEYYNNKNGNEKEIDDGNLTKTKNSLKNSMAFSNNKFNKKKSKDSKKSNENEIEDILSSTVYNYSLMENSFRQNQNKKLKKEIFNALSALFLFEKNFTEIKNQPLHLLKNQTKYYLISLKWLKTFKKSYNFKIFKFGFEVLTRYMEIDYYSESLYKILDDLYNDTKLGYLKTNPKYNFNENYIMNLIDTNNNDTNVSTLYYTNFAILDKKTYDFLEEIAIIFKQKIINENFSLVGVIGNLSLLLKIGKNDLQIIILENYDDFKEEYIIHFNDYTDREKYFEEIKNSGPKQFLFLHQVDVSKIEKQYLTNINGAFFKNIGLEKVKQNELLISLTTCINPLNNSFTISKYLNTIYNENTKINYPINNEYVNYNDNKKNNIINNESLDNDKKNNVINNEFLNENNYLKNFIGEPPKIGLMNLGNTCYMNSAFQCLANISYIIKNFYFKYLKNELFIGPMSFLTKQFCELLVQLYPKEKEKYMKPIRPINIYQVCGCLNPSFSTGLPNDTKDFLLFLLKRIHTETNTVTNNINIFNSNLNIININDDGYMRNLFNTYFANQNNSYISNIFYWGNRFSSNCQRCHNTTYSYNESIFLIVNLEETRKNILSQRIEFQELKNQYLHSGNSGKFKRFYDEFNNFPISLIDCIKFYNNPKEINTRGQLYCNCCQSSTIFKLQNTFYFLPSIFIIVLNRGKNNCFKVKMEYPAELDISPELIISEKSPRRYELISVITLLGTSGIEGHFIAFCKSPIDNKWYKYNDNIVELAENTDVFNLGNAYVLFYKKIKNK